MSSCKSVSRYQKTKLKNENISQFLKDFFRVFSVIKRYERGIANENPGCLGYLELNEEGEPVNASLYKIDWAQNRIQGLKELVGRYNSDIEGIFLASAHKIINELEERAEKFTR